MLQMEREKERVKANASKYMRFLLLLLGNDMEMAHNLYLFTFVLDRSLFGFLFHCPENLWKFRVFINNLGRKTFSTKRTSFSISFQVEMYNQM